MPVIIQIIDKVIITIHYSLVTVADIQVSKYSKRHNKNRRVAQRAQGEYSKFDLFCKNTNIYSFVFRKLNRITIRIVRSLVWLFFSFFIEWKIQSREYF